MNVASTARWLATPIGIAVSALGLSQIVSWGTTLYVLAVLGEPIAADTGWSRLTIFGGLTLGLLISGATSQWIGRLIDRRGARAVMTVGAILNALGLAVVAFAQSEAVYLAGWAVLGVAMRCTLYDAAFAALVQASEREGRRAISLLTLWGGFASTVFWPIAHELNEAYDWRVTLLIFAALNAGFCAPLHWAGLGRGGPAADNAAKAPAPAAQAAPPVGPTAAAPSGPYLQGAERRIAMVLFSVAVAAFAYILGAASAHLVTLIQTSGVSLSVAVSVAALKGVAQVGGRVWEIVFAGSMPPVRLARVPVWLTPLAFALLLFGPQGFAVALVFTILFGVANGLITIVRGALPLALFGPEGYGATLGLLATPYLVVSAVAPLAFAWTVEQGGHEAGAWSLLGCALLSLAAMEVLAAWRARRERTA